MFPYEGLQIADPIQSQNEPQFERPESSSERNLPVLEHKWQTYHGNGVQCWNTSGKHIMVMMYNVGTQVANIMMKSVGTQVANLTMYGVGAQVANIIMYSVGTQVAKIMVYSVGTQVANISRYWCTVHRILSRHLNTTHQRTKVT